MHYINCIIIIIIIIIILTPESVTSMGSILPMMVFLGICTVLCSMLSGVSIVILGYL